MLSTIRRFGPRHRWLIIALCLFTFVLPVVDVALPLLMGASVDGDSGAIGVLLLMAVARFGLQASRRFCNGYFSFSTQHNLRAALFRALQGVDEPAARRFGTGQVVSRSISDLNAIQSTTAMLPLLFSSVTELVLITVIVLWISPLMALIVLGCAPVLLWVTYRSRRAMYEPTHEISVQSARVATQVEQVVTGMPVVKSFAQEPQEQARYHRLTYRLYELKLFLSTVTARFQPALSNLPNVALVATIALGGWLAMRGAITVGEFLSVATYITMLSRLTRHASGMLVHLHTTRASVDRVLELIDTPQRPRGQRRVTGPVGLRGQVDLGHAIVDVDIAPGSTVVVRGPVAAGKSRLAHALAGLSSSDAQHLFLPDNFSLLSVAEQDRPVVIMDQSFLYSATIRENIALGFPTTDAEILRAARIACADEFIADKGGLDTVVGERGVTLSGGQRQRIAIARAVLRHPGMIIFDDATSAIDPRTEAAILRNLAAAQQQSTVVYISHRDDGGFRRPDSFIDLPAPPPQELPSTSPEPASPSTALPQWMRTLPTPELPEPRGRFRLRQLLALAPGLIAAVVATLLATAAADITLPSFVHRAIDDGVAQQDSQLVFALSGIALAVVVLSWLAGAANAVLTSLTGERLLFALRQHVYRHLMRMDMLWYHSRASGQIMTRLTTDIDTLSSFLHNGLSQAIVSTTMLLGILAMLLATDLTLTAYVAGFLPIIVLVTVIFRRISQYLYTRARQQISTVNAVFQEAVMGLTTGQAYGYGSTLQQRLEAQSQAYVRRRAQSQAAVALYFPGINLLTYIAQAVVLAAGASHGVTDGAIVAFSLYLSMFFGPIQQLSQVFDSYQQASVSLQRLGDFLDESPQIHSGKLPVPAGTPAIEFDQVTFGYTDEAAPTVELTHTFRGMTAIVGATGAGKSTVLRLVNRFVDPDRGSIRVNGCDLRNISLPEWRRSIGTVPQEAHLFAGTVRSNIAYGKDGAANTSDDAAIVAALRRIGGLEFLRSIPGGLDGQVAEGGANLSAGQKNILALARAELLQPSVLLLDEATALIEDSEEEAIVDSIRRMSRGRTTLIIAHRLRTAAMADQVIVMNHGKIVEQGTHGALLARGGQYAGLWKSAHSEGHVSR